MKKKSVLSKTLSKDAHAVMDFVTLRKAAGIVPIESPTEKALRESQKVVDTAQQAFHDVDPSNASAVRIARRKMDEAELHHHKLWIAHHKEVMAKEKAGR